MVYDPGCISTVLSFLQEATPHFMPICALTQDDQIITLYQECLNNSFKILYRLVLLRESEVSSITFLLNCYLSYINWFYFSSQTEWITTEYLAEILYKHFLITIPTVIDLLVVYGRTNAQLISAFLTAIFNIEPKYINDLKEALKHLKAQFHVIQDQIDKNDQNTDFSDLAFFTLDCSTTIAILLDVCPKAIELCLEIQLEQSISNFYDTTVPLLYKQISQIDAESSTLQLLNQSRMELLTSFRCLSNYHLEKILKNPYV